MTIGARIKQFGLLHRRLRRAAGQIAGPAVMGDGGNLARLVGPDANMLDGRRAVSGVVGNCRARQHDLYRALQGAGRQRGQQRIAPKEQLAAKASADIGGDDAHVLLGDLQRRRQIGAAPGDHLIGSPDGHLVAVPDRHRGMRLHRHMALIGGGIGQIYLHLGGGKGGVNIADVFVRGLLRGLVDGGFFLCQRPGALFTAVLDLHQRRRGPGLLERLCHHQRNGLMVVLYFRAAQQSGRVSLAFAEFAGTAGRHDR